MSLKIRVPLLTSDPRRSRWGDEPPTLDLMRRTKTGLGEELPRRCPGEGGWHPTTTRGLTCSRESRWPRLTRSGSPNDSIAPAEGTSPGGDPLVLEDTVRIGDLAGSSRQRCFAACRIEICLLVSAGSKPSLEMEKPSKRALDRHPQVRRSSRRREMGLVVDDYAKLTTNILNYVPFLEKARTNQSSRYLSIRTPRSWKIIKTGAMTLVNTFGAVERPKQRALNRYVFPNATNQRNCHLSGWTGIWRYVSFKSMETTQSPLRTARRTDWLVSILNQVWRMNRFRWERSITSLHEPDAFQMTKRWL